MLTKLSALNQASGLTVEDVAEGGTDVLVTFTNGTYILLRAENGYDGCDADIEIKEYSFGESEIPHADVVRVGLMSEQELQAVGEERDRQWKLRQDASDRANFERLKRKFGDGQ
jgi:hypothetical protein